MSGNGAAPRPYTRGWRAPWRGQWGGFDDGHTRLSSLARRIEREELAADYLADTPERARLRRMVARYRALVEMLTSTLGSDPKSTIRRITAMQATADRQLARLDALGARRQQAGQTLADQLAMARKQQQAAGGRPTSPAPHTNPQARASLPVPGGRVPLERGSTTDPVLAHEFHGGRSGLDGAEP